MAKGSGGGKLLIVTGLVVVLAGAAGFNYWRNLQAEQQTPRPYRGLSDADLATLIEAYETEISGLESQWDDARSRRQTAREGGHVGDRAREFERIRRGNERKRELGATLSQHDAALRDLREEERLRAAERDVVATTLRRVLTL